MATACGDDFIACVTEGGEVWAWSNGEKGFIEDDKLLPQRVGGLEDFDAPVVMIAAGCDHSACAANGRLWSWGNGDFGKLGIGDEEKRQRPVRLSKEVLDGASAVMVACGRFHTVALTADGRVWTCGLGESGQLGHGNTANHFVLTHVAFCRSVDMVVAGARHSVAIDEGGGVWSWGKGQYGCLGHGDEEDRLVPTAITIGEARCEVRVIVVSAGNAAWAVS